MKTTARFITTLALALTAIGTWAKPYTFTAGMDIPLSADFATCGNCNPESDGYSIGSTGGSTTLTLALVNSEAGDYILTVLGGAKNLTAAYTLTVTDGASYTKTTSVTQIPTSDWTLSQVATLALDSLPAGNLTLTLAITSTTGSYAGNYGYFRFTKKSDFTTLTPPLSSPTTLNANYLKAVGCTANGSSIESTGDKTFLNFFLDIPAKAKYGMSYQHGSNKYSAKLNWALFDLDNNQVWPASGVATDDITNTGAWALSVDHSHTFNEYLNAGLYVLRGYVTDRETLEGVSGSYAGNYGNFAFTREEIGEYELTISTPTVWSDYLATATTVTVEEGGAIVFDATEHAAGGTFTLPTNIVLPGGASVADYYIFNTGARTTETYNGDGTVTIATTDGAVATAWIGGGGDTRWTTDANWSHGAPTATDSAVFHGAATVTSVDATIAVSSLRVVGGANVVFASAEPYSYCPSLQPSAVSGTGTITLYRAGIKAPAAGLEIPADVSIVCTTEKHTAHTKHRCELQGASADARLVVNGAVTCPLGDYDFMNAVYAKWVTFNGSVAFDNFITTNYFDNSNVYLNELEACRIGGLKGKGAVKCPNYPYFINDNNAFEGTVFLSSDTHFLAATAAGSNATWNVMGPSGADASIIFFESHSNNATTGAFDGEIHFGALNISLDPGRQSQSRFYFDYSQTLTVVVGEKGDDMTIRDGFGASGPYWGDSNRLDPDKVKFVKRGKGKLTSDLWGIQKWEVEEGEVEFKPIARKLSDNLRGTKTIETVDVSAGASVGGTTMGGYTADEGATYPYDYTLATVTFADGAMYKTYLASDGNGGYTATDLAPTTATFAGALKVTAGQEGAMTAPLRIKAFSATNGIGISESNVSMTDADAGTPYVWMPYLDNSQLWLRCRNSRAGLTIIFR